MAREFTVAALVGSLGLIATAVPAHASINTWCNSVYNSCSVGENMGSNGFCSGTIYQTNSSGVDMGRAGRQLDRLVPDQRHHLPRIVKRRQDRRQQRKLLE